MLTMAALLPIIGAGGFIVTAISWVLGVIKLIGSWF